MHPQTKFSARLKTERTDIQTFSLRNMVHTHTHTNTKNKITHTKKTQPITLDT